MQEKQEELNEFKFSYEPRIMNTITDGKSGAIVYVVRIKRDNTNGLAIVKIEELQSDRENEAKIHEKARQIAAKNKKDQQIPQIIDMKIDNNKSAIMYEFVGNRNSYTLNAAIDEEKAEHLDVLAKKIVHYLYNWNLDYGEDWISPFDLVNNTLGRRNDDKLLEAYHEIGIDTDDTFIQFEGMLFTPNPAKFFTEDFLWQGEEIDCLFGGSHGDFHGDNIILSKKHFSVIDLAELQMDTNIFYDEKYLELHLLMDYFKFATNKERKYWVKLTKTLARGLDDKVTIPYGRGHLILTKLLLSIRSESINLFKEANDPEVLTRLEPAYHLAGVAAGLNFLRKHPDPLKKFAAFMYASMHLKAVISHSTLQLTLNNDVAVPVNWPIVKDSKTYNKKQKRLLEIIEQRDLKIAVQPIVNLHTGSIVGVEFLSRDPEGIIQPYEIFKVAREMNNLNEITLLTSELFVEMSSYVTDFTSLGLFINIESDLSMTMLEKVLGKVKGINQQVVVELTEHAMKTKYAKFWREIAHSEGLQVALDDLGKGESQIAEINVVKPDIIKIIFNDIETLNPEILKERNYIDNTFQNEQFIVEQIESLADVQKSIVAGISYGQGYYFSHPPFPYAEDLPLEEWKLGFKHKLEGHK